MSSSREVGVAATKFQRLLHTAAKLPGVRVDRAEYLRKELTRYCTAEQIEDAIATTPAAAGVPLETVSRIAKATITIETTRATVLSTAAGLPGGLAMAALVPVDTAQYIGHMLRITQKLAYVYGWPYLLDSSGELDDETQSLLILFLGVMMGTQAATTGVAKVAQLLSETAAKRLPRLALTKGPVYLIVKKVAQLLGTTMTKRIFAGGVAKTVPVVGAAVSGGITVATFLPMSKRLQRHLASLETTKPGHRLEPGDAPRGAAPVVLRGTVAAEEGPGDKTIKSLAVRPERANTVLAENDRQ